MRCRFSLSSSNRGEGKVSYLLGVTMKFRKLDNKLGLRHLNKQYPSSQLALFLEFCCFLLELPSELFYQPGGGKSSEVWDLHFATLLSRPGLHRLLHCFQTSDPSLKTKCQDIGKKCIIELNSKRGVWECAQSWQPSGNESRASQMAVLKDRILLCATSWLINTRT